MLLVVGVGILIDSARVFTADRQCTSIAFEAARAGANALSAEELRGGAVIVDPGQARAAASSAAAAFVTGSGATLQSVAVNGDEVTVVVSANVDTWFPFISDRTVTEEATALASAIGD